MKKVTFELDERQYRRLERLAEENGATVESFLSSTVSEKLKGKAIPFDLDEASYMRLLKYAAGKDCSIDTVIKQAINNAGV